MGLRKTSWLALRSWLFVGLLLAACCGSSELYVKFLKAPHAFSNLNSATFAFEVLVDANGEDNCRNCTTDCRLDHSIASSCMAKEASYIGLQDGNHKFEVCANGSGSVGCASYNWTIGYKPHPLSFMRYYCQFANKMLFKFIGAFTT